MAVFEMQSFGTQLYHLWRQF